MTKFAVVYKPLKYNIKNCYNKKTVCRVGINTHILCNTKTTAADKILPTIDCIKNNPQTNYTTINLQQGFNLTNYSHWQSR